MKPDSELKRQALFETVVTVLGVSIGLFILHLNCIGAIA